MNRSEPQIALHALGKSQTRALLLRTQQLPNRDDCRSSRLAWLRHICARLCLPPQILSDVEADIGLDGALGERRDGQQWVDAKSGRDDGTVEYQQVSIRVLSRGAAKDLP